MVFVGMGAGSVEGATGTDGAHAVATTRTMERQRRVFFTIVLCMAEFPFSFKHTHIEMKTPLSTGEFSLSERIGYPGE
jgi:hypothetical protein